MITLKGFFILLGLALYLLIGFVLGTALFIADLYISKFCEWRKCPIRVVCTNWTWYFIACPLFWMACAPYCIWEWLDAWWDHAEITRKIVNLISAKIDQIFGTKDQQGEDNDPRG
jgi:hypothetical protein